MQPPVIADEEPGDFLSDFDDCERGRAESPTKMAFNRR
jgi:hypothetical protein